jgi:hypothetical protein
MTPALAAALRDLGVIPAPVPPAPKPNLPPRTWGGWRPQYPGEEPPW